MLARNGISECELLKLVPMKWSDWLMLSERLHHSCIVVTRMGLLSFANKQVSCLITPMVNIEILLRVSIHFSWR